MVTDSPSSLEPAKELRASLGYVKDYYISSKQSQISPNPTKDVYDLFLDLYKMDPVVAGAIDATAEEAVRNKGYFTGSKTSVERAERLFSKLDFYSVAEIHVRTQHLYGDSFIEFRYSEQNGKLEELHNLETTEMFIVYDVHGKILRYEQRPLRVGTNNLVVERVTVPVRIWSPEQIMFLPLKRLGSKIHSYSPLDPALRSLSARTYANYWLENVFKNFKPQTVYSVDNNISPEQIKMLVEAIRAADKDPSKKILAVGDLKIATTGMYEFKKDLVDIFNYLRQEVLTTIRVPGVYVGITYDANRGVSEFEANAFQSHLLRVQRDLEKLGNKILELEGIRATFRMRPPTIKSQTDIIDQAKKLRDMGFGDDVITPFLYNNGIPVPEDAEFEEENKISMDDYESRQGSGKGVTEGKYNLDENGKSEAGAEKQEERDEKAR